MNSSNDAKKLVKQSDAQPVAPTIDPSAESEITRFISALARRGDGISAYTVYGYERDLRSFALWFRSASGQSFAPQCVTTIDIRDYKGHLQTVAKCKPATINRKLSALRAYFAWAKLQRLVDDSPVQVRNLEEEDLAPHSIDERTYLRVLRCALERNNKRDICVLELLRHTGLRASELCSLHMDDVWITAQKGSVTVRSGKGGKFRAIPLNLDARKAITEYLAVRPKVADTHLLIGQRKNGIASVVVWKAVSKYGRLADVQPLAPHMLRHTFATTILQKGATLVEVQRLLAHKRLDTTARYLQPQQADLERAVGRLQTTES